MKPNILCIISGILLMGLCTLGMTSCTEKARALRDLEQLAKEVREHGSNYDVLTWKDVYVQYRCVNEEIDRHYADYSQRDRNRILRARSDIKQAAKDSLIDKIESFPYLKELLFMFISSVRDVETNPKAIFV